MASLAEWGPWVAETGHGGSLITMTLATVRFLAHAAGTGTDTHHAVQMHRSTSMWSMVLADGARRSRFAALFGKLAPLYLPHAGP